MYPFDSTYEIQQSFSHQKSYMVSERISVSLSISPQPYPKLCSQIDISRPLAPISLSLVLIQCYLQSTSGFISLSLSLWFWFSVFLCCSCRSLSLVLIWSCLLLWLINRFGDLGLLSGFLGQIRRPSAPNFCRPVSVSLLSPLHRHKFLITGSDSGFDFYNNNYCLDSRIVIYLQIEL